MSSASDDGKAVKYVNTNGKRVNDSIGAAPLKFMQS